MFTLSLKKIMFILPLKLWKSQETSTENFVEYVFALIVTVCEMLNVYVYSYFYLCVIVFSIRHRMFVEGAFTERNVNKTAPVK